MPLQIMTTDVTVSANDTLIKINFNKHDRDIGTKYCKFAKGVATEHPHGALKKFFIISFLHMLIRAVDWSTW